MVKVINIISIGLQNTTHHHQRYHDHQAKDNSIHPSGGAVTSLQSFFLLHFFFLSPAKFAEVSVIN